MLSVGEIVADTESDAMMLAVEKADKEDVCEGLEDKLDIVEGEGGGGTVTLAIDEDELIELAVGVTLSEGDPDELSEMEGDCDTEALRDGRELLDSQVVAVFDTLLDMVPEPDLDGVAVDEVERLVHGDPDVLTDLE